MHRLVMSGFYGWTDPGEPDPRAQMGVLHTWKLDLRNRSLVLIVQSRVQPDWSELPHAALADEIAVLPVDMTVREGAVYTFRTVVNPTRQRGAAQDAHAPRRRLADTTPTTPASGSPRGCNPMARHASVLRASDALGRTDRRTRWPYGCSPS